MTNERRKFDIYDRALIFASRVAALTYKLPRNPALIEYCKQLIRSSGSIGANIEEADGALTKKDFINKIGIARRESRESRHWLRLITFGHNTKDPDLIREIDWQKGEAGELLLILSSIINKTLRNK